MNRDIPNVSARAKDPAVKGDLLEIQRWAGRISDLLKSLGNSSAGGVVIGYGSSASAGQTTVPLLFGGGLVGYGYPGIPAPAKMLFGSVAVTFMADNEPAGPWTATLQVRPEGELSFIDRATFTFDTTE